MVQPNSQRIDDKPRRVVVACTLESFKQLLQDPSPTTIASSVEDWVLAVSPSPSPCGSRAEHKPDAPISPQVSSRVTRSKQQPPPRYPLRPRNNNQASKPIYPILKRKMPSDHTPDPVHNPSTRRQRTGREKPSQDLAKTPTRKGRSKTTTKGRESEDTDEEGIYEQGIDAEHEDDDEEYLPVQTPRGQRRDRSTVIPQDYARNPTRNAGSKTNAKSKSAQEGYTGAQELRPDAENEHEETMPTPTQRGPKRVQQRQKSRPDFPPTAIPLHPPPHSLPTALSSPTKSRSSRSMEITPRAMGIDSTSPSKKSSNKGLSTINRRSEMAQMTPPVEFKTPGEWRRIGPVSDNIRNFWVDHIRAAEEKERVIPWEFKERMQRATNTPMKTKPSIPDSCYIPLGTASTYTPEDLELVWSTLSDVVKSTEQYRYEDYTEAHWISKTVTPLLNLVRRLRRYTDPAYDFEKLEALDMTTVQMSDSLTPHSPTSLYRDLNRKIDAAMSLHLRPSEKTILQRGRYNTTSPPHNQTPSINQTSFFTNFSPIFMHIEVKRPNTDKDPLIQLGAWTTAEFTKRTLEEYSLDMPVCAIDVCGDDWNIYLVYARIDDAGAEGSFTTQFVGPIEMGKTTSLRGCFTLLAFLTDMAEWGLGTYRPWFEREILDHHRPGNSGGQ